MSGTCPARNECRFFTSVSSSAVLRIKYATMYPYCNASKHETCMRWWLMQEGKAVPEDLLPDGGKDWFSAEAHRPASSAMRVLVVDDMPVFRKALCGLVQDAANGALTIVEAQSAEEALEILRSDTDGWTLVATDYNMGGKSGYELIVELRSLPAHAQLPAIVFTSEADTSKRSECSSLPRVRWLVKRPEKEPFGDAWRELVIERKA